MTTISVSNSNVFSDCPLITLESGGDAGLAMLNCISNKFVELENSVSAYQTQNTNWLLVYAGALVFFMQAGFAMLVGGSVRKKNLQNTMLKNLLDCCGAAVAFWAVGYAFAYGGDGTYEGKSFIGTTNFFGTGLGGSSGDGNNISFAFWFFQLSFCAASVTIVAGTLAERCQMGAYLGYSVYLTGFVYPVVVHTFWSAHGVLSAYMPVEDRFRGVGCIDFAGSGVVHITGGTIALIAAYILGPRVGRFYDARGQVLDKPASFPGHSIPLQVLGTLVLWFGFYGFNPGSALSLTHSSNISVVAARAAANTTLAAGSGALSAMLVNLLRNLRPSSTSKTNDMHQGTKRNFVYSFNLLVSMNGCLSGLVGITAGSGTVELWSACIIGIVAGILYLSSSDLLVRFKIDDAVDAIPVHMVGGIWGVLAVGLFSSPEALKDAFGDDSHVGWVYNWSDLTLMTNQIIAVLFTVTWSTVTMFPFFLFLNYMGWFRSDGLEEVVGLDVRYHGGNNEVDEAEMLQDIETFRELINQQQPETVRSGSIGR